MKRKNSIPTLFSIAFMAMAVNTQATDFTWTNGAANLTWNDSSANWDAGSGNTPWVDGNTAIFGATGVGTVTVSGTRSIAGLTTNADGYTLSGGGISLTTPATPFVINSNILVSNTTLISGTGGMEKSGSGQLEVRNGNNSFSGNILVSGGTLRSNGMGGATNSTLGATTSSRTITINDGGTIVLVSNNTFGDSNSTNLPTFVVNSGGTLHTANYNIVANITLNGGALTSSTGASGQYQSFRINGSVTVGGSSVSTITKTGGTGGVTLANTQTIFDVADSVTGPDADLIVDNSLMNTTGARGLNKTGAGTMVLTYNNLYTGATTITAGTLQVGSDGDDGSLATNGITNNSALVCDQSGIGLAAQLAAYPISGTGTLTKTGAGKLTLSNSLNSYSGTTTVNEGQLYVNGALSASSAVSVEYGALLGGTGTIANLTTVADGGSIEGGANGAGILTFTNGLSFTGPGNINVGDLANYTATPALAAGTLTTSGMDGSISIIISSIPGIGSYQIASYTGAAFDASKRADFALATPLPSRALGTLNFSTPNLIKVNIASLDTLKWTGGASADWDTSTAGNWKLASNSAATTYIDGDTVAFDDTATSFTVSLAGDVSPAQVTFDNSANNYILTSSTNNGIVGAATLTKNGTGNLTITNLNPSAGATTINGGTLFLGDGTTDGSWSSTNITNNAALVYNLTNADRTENTIITGIGRVTKTGAPNRTLTLAAANTHSGGTILAGGTLIAGVPDVGGSPGPNSLGTGTLTLQTGTTFRGRSVHAIPSAVDIDGTGIVLFGSNPSNLVLGGNLTGDATDAFSVTERVRLAGDNSGFGGTVTVPVGGGNFVYLGSADSGSANAKFIVDGQLIAFATGAFTVKIGSLEGSGNLSGPYEGLANQPTFEIGGRNEDSTFSGRIRNNEGDSTFISNTVSLIKVGTGILALTGLHTYSGDTTISAGKLSLGQVNVSNETSTVNIATGAVLDLAYSGTDTVDKLFIGGVQQPAGDYTSNGVTITGGGTLHVTTGPPAPAGYSSWAFLNGASANLDEDHDGDGVSNGIEYFIGGPNGPTTGFTSLPGVTNASGVRSVTWAHAADYAGAYGTDFEVETSTTLVGAWTLETLGVNVTITGNDVKYTFPPGPVKNFARLKVTGP